MRATMQMFSRKYLLFAFFFIETKLKINPINIVNNKK